MSQTKDKLEPSEITSVRCKESSLGFGPRLATLETKKTDLWNIGMFHFCIFCTQKHFFQANPMQIQSKQHARNVLFYCANCTEQSENAQGEIKQSENAQDEI